MSGVKTSDNKPISDIADVYDLYTGIGADESRSGIEVELGFFDPETDDQKPMDVCQNESVKGRALDGASNVWVRQEPTAETLEANSIAARYQNRTKVLDDIQDKLKILTQAAQDVGVKRSYFQELPNASAELLLSQVVNVERYQQFFNPPRADMTGIAAYFSVCKSNQVSVSYTNPDHLLDNVRRLYFLAPFFFLLSDNSSAFSEGKAVSYQPGMHYRKFLNDKGGYVPYIFSAASGEEFIVSHIEHVMRNPLYVFYDENNVLQRIPSGTWSSFNELKERGLNTPTNYFFAETILWPDVKIAALKDENDEPYGHRFEARMIGVGAWQHQAMYLVITELAHNQNYAGAVNALLARYGLSVQNTEAEALLANAYDQACNHGNKFFDIPYGTGRMQDFAKEFADITEQAFEGKGFDDALEPLLRICQTELTDAKVNRCLFDSLQKTLDFQLDYDVSLFENPNRCAHMIFEEELARKGNGNCDDALRASA